MLLLLSAAGAFAQVPASAIAQDPGAYQPDASAQPSPTDATPPGPASLRAAAAENEKARLAVNPVTGMTTSPGTGYEPLTGQERWKLYWKQNYFSVGAYFGPVFTALVLDQATGSPQQWGGGFPGYGRRVASRLPPMPPIQGTFQAPVAALLHEDVRYISSPQPGGKRRVLHAIAYSFLTYNTEGHPTLNFANLGGYYAATALSTIWLPSQHSVAKYTFSNATESIALTLPVNLLQEFWPEVVHTVFRRREQR